MKSPAIRKQTLVTICLLGVLTLVVLSYSQAAQDGKQSQASATAAPFLDAAWHHLSESRDRVLHQQIRQ